MIRIPVVSLLILVGCAEQQVPQLDAFRVGAGSVAHAARLTLDLRGGCCTTNPLVWAADGRIGIAAVDTHSLNRMLLLADAHTGAADTLLLEQAAPSSSGGSRWRVEVADGGGRNIALAVPPPFASSYLTAYGHGGASASVHTSEYHIRRMAADGRALRPIRGDYEGPAVTRAEHDSVMAIVEARRSRGERVSDVRIASRKPPVSAIWFDLDGRLWVELTAPASSAERWAHVYSLDGSFLYDARWPREIVFAPWGAIRGDLAWGVRRDALRAEQVVRVRFE